MHIVHNHYGLRSSDNFNLKLHIIDKKIVAIFKRVLFIP